MIVTITREKIIEIARNNGATEPSNGLWVMSVEDLEKISRALINEHKNRLPAWLLVAGYFCTITGFIFWLVYLSNEIPRI